MVYWPLPRFLDWWNGRRDGRVGIPWFEPAEEPPPSSVEGQPSSAAGEPGTTGPADASLADSAPANRAEPVPPPTAGPTAEPTERGGLVREPCGPPIIPPPYLRYLRSRAADAARLEWVRAEARIARAQARVDQLRATAASLLQATVDAKDYEAGLPVEPDERTMNERTYTDELRQRPESLSRSRRRGDHAKAIDAAKAARRRAEESYLAQSAEIARIEALIAAEKRVRTARILRIHEHMRRREASYWRHLVRHHPHGARLSGCLDPAAPDLPSWVRETDLADPRPDPSPADGPPPVAPRTDEPPGGWPDVDEPPGGGTEEQGGRA